MDFAMRDMLSLASCKSKVSFLAVLVAGRAIAAFPFPASTQQPILPGHAPCDGPNFPGPRFGAGGGPIGIATDDLDGDGDADLAIASEATDHVSVLLNRGNGTFPSGDWHDTGHDPCSVAIDDLDGDGDEDLALATSGSDSVSVLLNQGNGTFASDVMYWTGWLPRSIAIGDLDGDGDPDLATANEVSNSVSVLLGRCP